MPREYQCYVCKANIIFKEGQGKTKFNPDGSVHVCETKKSSTTVSKTVKKALRQQLESPDDDYVDEYEELPDDALEAKKEQESKQEKVEVKETMNRRIAETKDNLPERPSIKITKIRVARTSSINYGVGKKWGIEKESTLDSFTLEMEMETSANFRQAEIVTKDLIETINYITKVEFKEKTVLRLLK